MSCDDALAVLARVRDQHVDHAVAQLDGLPDLDLEVDRLALGAAVGLVDQHPGVGQGEAAPGAPAASSTAAALSRLARRRWWTIGACTNCMVSWMANRAIMSPPGELM